MGMVSEQRQKERERLTLNRRHDLSETLRYLRGSVFEFEECVVVVDVVGGDVGDDDDDDALCWEGAKGCDVEGRVRGCVGRQSPRGDVGWEGGRCWQRRCC